MPETVDPDPDLRTAMVELIREVKPCRVDDIHQAAADLPIGLGFDSLDLVALASRVYDRYGIDVGADPDDFKALESLDGLTELIRARRTR